MSEIIDCRGLSCPEPVMHARKALQNQDDQDVTVMVSNTVARDNVSRAAKSMGRRVEVEESGDDFKLTISK